MLRLRGAVLLGGSLEERKTNYKVLRDAYNLRSATVHAGAVNDAKADEILQNGATLCANLITHILSSGAMPQWDELILAP